MRSPCHKPQGQSGRACVHPAINPRAGAEGHAFTHAVKSRAEWRYRSAEGRSEARRAKRLIIAFVFAVVLALAFFSAFSAPKTHVKSQEHLLIAIQEHPCGNIIDIFASRYPKALAFGSLGPSEILGW
jgi:hypothetical protein